MTGEGSMLAKKLGRSFGFSRPSTFLSPVFCHFAGLISIHLCNIIYWVSVFCLLHAVIFAKTLGTWMMYTQARQETLNL